MRSKVAQRILDKTPEITKITVREMANEIIESQKNGKEPSEVQKKLMELSKGNTSNWLEKAKWRKRNRWWLRIVAIIQLKYLTFKSKLGLRK